MLVQWLASAALNGNALKFHELILCLPAIYLCYFYMVAVKMVYISSSENELPRVLINPQINYQYP